MSGKLYVVGTPIGNLGDLSPRALETLENADFIAAEDTRVTLKLLNRFGLKKEMISYFEHNKGFKGDIIIDRILKGETCALVSDAGMPAISDPGEDLVKRCRDFGVEIESVPGPTAVTTALSISGFPTKRFCFEGFLSVEKKERQEHLEEIKDENRTMVFYEAPHKLKATLKDMLEILGNREIALVKELTKIHEDVFITTFEDALVFYEENPPKGEFVVIIKGADKEKEIYTLSDAVKIAKGLMEKGESASFSAKEAAKITGIKKGDIYREILK